MHTVNRVSFFDPLGAHRYSLDTFFSDTQGVGGREKYLCVDQRGDDYQKDILAFETFVGLPMPPLVVCGPNIRGMLGSLRKSFKNDVGYEMQEVALTLRLMRTATAQLSGKCRPAFVDLGANVGSYALRAAQAGFFTVAVEAEIRNSACLARSALLSGVAHNMLIVPYAISNASGSLKMWGCHGPDDPGLCIERSRRAAWSPNTDSVRDGAHVKRAVSLDALARFLPCRSVAVKMDVQMSELDALRGASRFFAQLQVVFVLMDWGLYWKFDEEEAVMVREIDDIMSGLLFVPYAFKSRGSFDLYRLSSDDLLYLCPRHLAVDGKFPSVLWLHRDRLREEYLGMQIS